MKAHVQDIKYVKKISPMTARERNGRQKLLASVGKTSMISIP